jgi:hypothetical protein
MILDRCFRQGRGVSCSLDIKMFKMFRLLKQVSTVENSKRMKTIVLGFGIGTMDFFFFLIFRISVFLMICLTFIQAEIFFRGDVSRGKKPSIFQCFSFLYLIGMIIMT